MFQSFFDSPEISLIFKRKDMDKKMSTSVNSRSENECAECLKLRECKQLKKRDRNQKKSKSRTQNQQTSSGNKLRKPKMDDVEKITMMNQDNVYYDYDEEKGIVVEKKHSVVIPPCNVLSKRKARRNCDEKKSVFLSFIEEQLRNELAEEQITADSHGGKTFEAANGPEEQFHAGSYTEKQSLSVDCNCPEEQFQAGSCLDAQCLAGSCPEEQYLDGSCPSDSAYDTTHDELTESLDRLTLVKDKLVVEERPLIYGDENMKFKETQTKDSPYRRCRSRAVCGRNCKLCHGSNNNIIQTAGSKISNHIEKQANENAGHKNEYNKQEIQTGEGRTNTDKKIVSDFDSDEIARTKQKIVISDKNSTKQEFYGNANESIDSHYNSQASYVAQDRNAGTITNGIPEASYATQRENDTIVNNGECGNLSQYNLEQAHRMFSNGPHLVMLYDFKAEHEDDVTAQKGEIVLLLDNRDRDWVWVMTQDFMEGYVPKSLTTQYHPVNCEECAVQELEEQQVHTASKSSNISWTSSKSSDSSNEKEATIIRNGIKMIAVSNFESTEKGKLCVVKGDEVVIDLKSQKIPEWLWAFSPRQKSYGFIPEHLVDALEVSSV